MFLRFEITSIGSKPKTHLNVSWISEHFFLGIQGQAHRNSSQFLARMQSTHLPLLGVLLDAALYGQALQLGLGEHAADVHDLLQGERQALLLPLFLHKGSKANFI